MDIIYRHAWTTALFITTRREFHYHHVHYYEFRAAKGHHLWRRKGFFEAKEEKAR